MELLAREQTAEQNVHYYLKSREEPIQSLLNAFEEYRQVCLAVIFADFETQSAPKAKALWAIHTEGKKYFHRELSALRNRPGQHSVAIRQLMKFYLQFIKASQRFYRDYIYQLSVVFGGIPELQAVAHHVKNDASGESSLASATHMLRQKALESCHQTLIYLGDLSRYRASEKLDKTPDFGPAIGYYDLACALIPASGMGHHQLAVVALEQKQHLRAIYHLYRAMMVDDLHPNAANNLKLEFDKTNLAWDRGELIQKGPPNDPEVSKKNLIGWFVRLHSICFKGENFKGFDELEREVLGRLAAEIKVKPLDSTLMRMVMVNLAAQFSAGEKFQENPTETNQDAFLSYFRINVKTFTTLLQVFYEDLTRVSGATVDDADDQGLAIRLTNVGRRLLPALRLYSSWLLSVTELLNGLSSTESLKTAIDQFWRMYARSIDLVAAVFPIWDLEDLDEVPYMLEEDADTVSFKPLQHDRTSKIWRIKDSGLLKPRFSDQGIVRATADEEMLARVKEFLVDGLYLANDDDSVPIKLRVTRILHRDAEDVEPLPIVAPAPPATTSKPAAKAVPKPAPKPLTYAAAAANGPTRAPRQPGKQNGILPKPSGMSRDAQLSRMVDDLVDDDESNNPITPPQQHVSHPAVVTTHDTPYSTFPRSAHDIAQTPAYAPPPKQPPIGTPAGTTSPSPRSPQIAITGTPTNRLQTLSSLWNDSSAQQQPSSFPTGLPMGTLNSPAQLQGRGHSRVNSASSVRSRTSQNIADSWASLEVAPGAKGAMPPPLSTGFGGVLGGAETSTGPSPLLFGAGGGVWSTRPSSRGMNVTPPSGQGG